MFNLDHVNDLNAAQKTVDNFKDLGYGACRKDLPYINDIKDYAKHAEVLIFHGHGSNSSFALYNGKKYGENTFYTVNVDEIKKILPKSTACHISFVYFGSCHSADNGGSGQNLPDAAVSQGVKCAIGFRNNVAGCGQYIRDVMETIKDHPDYTIKKAVEETNKKLSWRFKTDEDDSPSNPNNLYIAGDKNLRLGKRY